MKEYYRFKIHIQVKGREKTDEDLGQKFAIEHRISKASQLGQKPYVNPNEDATKGFIASRFLSKGSYKNVYDTPSSIAQLNSNRLEFVLAKMDCSNDDFESNQKHLKGAISDQVKTMILLNQPLTSIFVNFANEMGPRLYLYLARYKGRDLIKPMQELALSRRLQVKYFLDICKELKYLHQHGYAHYDLKPENVMVDESAGATLIDFGSVQRSWYPITGGYTKEYGIIDAWSYERNFKFQYKECMHQSPDNIWKILKPVADFMDKVGDKFKKEKETNPQPNYMAKLVEGKPYLSGVIMDIGALTQMALMLGIWDINTEPFFIELIGNYFRPSLLEPIIKHLKEEQPEFSIDSPVKLNILSNSSGIEVCPFEEPGVKPADVQETIKNNYREYLGGENEDPTKILDVSIKVFRRFKNITEIYKQNEIDSKKSVDSKFYALTNLINSLAYIYDEITLRNTLARIYAVALVNRSFFGVSKTRSFDLLFTASKDPSITPIIRNYFYSLLTEFTSREDFYTAVKYNITGLILPDEQKNAFNKTSGFDTILKLLDEEPVENTTPINESQARSLLAQNSYSTRLKGKLETNRVLATYARAANLANGTKNPNQEERIKQDRQYIAGFIEKSYNEMVGGFNTNKEKQDYERDINALYFKL